MANVYHRSRGFSLVELSIVLVILGLLVGGVLSGQSLIRAAELRSVTQDFMRYSTAVMSFRDKYQQLPGDMAQATKFWGASSTVDGDGDGVIEWPTAASQSGEVYQFWNQLARAGLIEGSYTGIAGAGSLWHDIQGENVPSSRISSVGWNVEDATGFVGNAEMLNTGGRTTGLSVGKVRTNSHSFDPFLKTEEAWSIDRKIDDGMPGQGKIMGRWWSTCTEAQNKDEVDKPYKLAVANANACALLYFF